MEKSAPPAKLTYPFGGITIQPQNVLAENLYFHKPPLHVLRLRQRRPVELEILGNNVDLSYCDILKQRRLVHLVEDEDVNIVFVSCLLLIFL